MNPYIVCPHFQKPVDPLILEVLVRIGTWYRICLEIQFDRERS